MSEAELGVEIALLFLPRMTKRGMSPGKEWFANVFFKNLSLFFIESSARPPSFISMQLSCRGYCNNNFSHLCARKKCIQRESNIFDAKMRLPKTRKIASCFLGETICLKNLCCRNSFSRQEAVAVSEHRDDGVRSWRRRLARKCPRVCKRITLIKLKCRLIAFSLMSTFSSYGKNNKTKRRL